MQACGWRGDSHLLALYSEGHPKGIRKVSEGYKGKIGVSDALAALRQRPDNIDSRKALAGTDSLWDEWDEWYE